MIGSAGRRLVESTVGLFALLGFLYVPLGRHTGFEHVRAVLSTPQAAAAVEDLTAAASRMRERALQLLTGRPSPPTPSDDEQRARSRLEAQRRGPRPVAPKLE